MDLGKLNIPVKEGEVIITLIYNGEEIASVSKRIVLEKSIEQDLTENITTFDEITGVNVTIETIQYGAVLNSPVKWKKNIKLTQLANVSVELPRQAENITIYKIIGGESGISSDSEDQAGEKLESPSVEDKTISKADSSISSEEGVSETDKQGIKEKEQIKKREKVKSEIELEVTVETGGIFSRTFNFVTGRIIEIIEKEEVKEVFIDENVTEFEIEYNTPAPVAFEKNVSGGKLITISSKVHYKNVLVYTKLPEPVPENNVKLYNYENGSKVLVNFKGYSIAENNTGVATKNEDNQTSENKIELNVTSGEGSDLPSATGRVVEELTPSAPSETDVTNPENEFC